MVDLYTSYLAQARVGGPMSEAARGATIPIVRHFMRYTPADLRPRHLPTLSPPADLLKAFKVEEIDFETFAAEFRAQVLNPLDPHLILAQIKGLVAPESPHVPILACYCGPGRPCHRHLVSAWLKAHMPHLEIVELQIAPRS